MLALRRDAEQRLHTRISTRESPKCSQRRSRAWSAAKGWPGDRSCRWHTRVHTWRYIQYYSFVLLIYWFRSILRTTTPYGQSEVVISGSARIHTYILAVDQNCPYVYVLVIFFCWLVRDLPAPESRTCRTPFRKNKIKKYPCEKLLLLLYPVSTHLSVHRNTSLYRNLLVDRQSCAVMAGVAKSVRTHSWSSNLLR
jgi:hypothetical protein